MSTQKVIRILIADNYPIIREGLVAVIARQSRMQIVAQASTGQEAVALFEEHHPDITLMDMLMPQMDGLKATAAIRKEHPEARIILFSLDDGEETLYRILCAGAQGFLRQDAPLEYLLDVIGKVHDGQTCFPLDIMSIMADRIGRQGLTKRELDVLRLMAKGKTNPEIGSELSIAVTTVKSHINSILQKLDVHDRTQAVAEAFQRGLVRVE